MNTVYLNGEYLPAQEAKISPFDRGFLFGDGVYEVLPVYEGRTFCADEHLARMARSLKGIDMPDIYKTIDWSGIIHRLIKDNGPTQCLYLQVTRGAPLNRTHLFPTEPCKPTVFAMSMSLTPVQTQGISAITLEDIRWLRCDIKTVNLLGNVLLAQRAKEQQVNEAILHRDGMVIEAASSNVFIVDEHNHIITPPLQPLMLGGITRQHVIDLARQEGLVLKEEPITVDKLASARELWLTSASKEITPVITLNHKPVGLGKPGEIWHTMFTAYQASKRSKYDAIQH